MQIEFIPGTTMPYSVLKGSAFELLVPMLNATGGLSLSQVCAITGLEGSTIQNWVKRGLVAKPVDKKYFERQLARILMINALRDCMQLDRIAELLRYLNGLVEDKSDDIIREAQLFDYLCEILRKIDLKSGFSLEIVENTVLETIADYSGPFADSKHKLCKGLCLMTIAYVSGRLKSQADFLYDELMG